VLPGPEGFKTPDKTHANRGGVNLLSGTQRTRFKKYTDSTPKPKNEPITSWQSNSLQSPCTTNFTWRV